MSFNPNIPLVTDNMVKSAPQLRANFQAIASAWGQNHSSLTTNEDQGAHQLLSMVTQPGDPATTATQVALYNKLVSSVPNLFLRPKSSGTPIQLTFSSIKNTTANQYSFLAGPFIIYGGSIPNPTIGQVITLTPGSSLIYVDLSMGNPDGAIITNPLAIPTNVSGTSFTLGFAPPIPGTIKTMFYLAIGLP